MKFGSKRYKAYEKRVLKLIEGKPNAGLAGLFMLAEACGKPVHFEFGVSVFKNRKLIAPKISK